ATLATATVASRHIPAVIIDVRRVLIAFLLPHVSSRLPSLPARVNGLTGFLRTPKIRASARGARYGARWGEGGSSSRPLARPPPFRTEAARRASARLRADARDRGAGARAVDRGRDDRAARRPDRGRGQG